MSNGNNAAHRAAYLGDINKINQLINNSNLHLFNTPNNLGILPISLADRKGHIEIVKLLFSYTNLTIIDNYNNNLIHLAAKYHNQEIMEEILHRNNNLPENERLDVNAKAYNGNTAMHIASYFNNDEVVSPLYNHNAKVDIQNNDGQSPIDISISSCNINMIDTFYKIASHDVKMIDIFCKCGQQVTEFFANKLKQLKDSVTSAFNKDDHSTLSNEDYDEAHLQDDCNSQDVTDNPSPVKNEDIFQAAANNDIAFLSSNLVNNANINDTNEDHRTALDIAVSNENLEFAKQLLALGARTDISYLGFSPLHIAVQKGDINMIKLLIDYQNVNIRDQIDGNTPLHLIYEQRELNSNVRTEIINELINKGAQLNIKNYYNITAKQIAKYNDIIIDGDKTEESDLSGEEASGFTINPELIAGTLAAAIPSIATNIVGTIAANNKPQIENHKLENSANLEDGYTWPLVFLATVAVIASIGIVYTKPSNNSSTKEEIEPLGENSNENYV
jgi:serine/threonine-protein phosphatase 6 regulatory ankyrin repeat subunit A/serine/threonine-protein phosphatase 6 regulatory ankyrin repeat subunit B